MPAYVRPSTPAHGPARARYWDHTAAEASGTASWPFCRGFKRARCALYTSKLGLSGQNDDAQLTTQVLKEVLVNRDQRLDILLHGGSRPRREHVQTEEPCRRRFSLVCVPRRLGVSDSRVWRVRRTFDLYFPTAETCICRAVTRRWTMCQDRWHFFTQRELGHELRPPAVGARSDHHSLPCALSVCGHRSRRSRGGSHCHSQAPDCDIQQAAMPQYDGDRR